MTVALQSQSCRNASEVELGILEDTSIGISEDHVGRLFVAFQQLDSGIRRKFQAPGLGLVITKRIATAQGGRVGFVTIATEGSMFFVALPRMLAIP